MIYYFQARLDLPSPVYMKEMILGELDSVIIRVMFEIVDEIRAT